MTKLVNCRDIEGHVFTMVLHQDKIESVTPQETLQLSVPDAIDLRKFRQTGEEVVVNCGGELIVPAMVDCHVHSRDPGFSHKETWATLAAGAFKGGVVAVCDMPNTMPPTMHPEQVLAKAELARASGLDFGIFLGVGKDNVHQLADILNTPGLPLCGAKVYYGQSTGELMYSDLERLGRELAGLVDKRIVFHSEDQCCIDRNIALVKDLHLQDNASFQLHSEIRSSASAHASTKVILQWAVDTGIPSHIAHVSTPVEVEMIAEAKAQGADVTCEVAPHHLIFSTDDYERLGPLLKMNPPVRTKMEQEELASLFGRGRVEVFATDHAPHTLEEKRHQDYAKCPSGVPGVEYFTPLLLQIAQDTGLSLEQAVAVGATKPAELFGFQELGTLEPGKLASFLWLEQEPYKIGTDEVACKSGWTPYRDITCSHTVNRTWHRGKTVYDAPR